MPRMIHECTFDNNNVIRCGVGRVGIYNREILKMRLSSGLLSTSVESVLVVLTGVRADSIGAASPKIAIIINILKPYIIV